MPAVSMVGVRKSLAGIGADFNQVVYFSQPLEGRAVRQRHRQLAGAARRSRSERRGARAASTCSCPRDTPALADRTSMPIRPWKTLPVYDLTFFRARGGRQRRTGSQKSGPSCSVSWRPVRQIKTSRSSAAASKRANAATKRRCGQLQRPIVDPQHNRERGCCALRAECGSRGVTDGLHSRVIHSGALSRTRGGVFLGSVYHLRNHVAVGVGRLSWERKAKKANRVATTPNATTLYGVGLLRPVQRAGRHHRRGYQGPLLEHPALRQLRPLVAPHR